MDVLRQVIDLFLHLDVTLNAWVETLGPALYVVLFMILFCETGLVVTPFLPGDTLLFTIGAVASVENSKLNLPLTVALLAVGAIAGDATNYAIGYRVGPRVFTSETSRWLNRRHLFETQGFYERHGGKTIILARFLPIFRTFAPFIAGIGKMTYSRFAMFNVVGAVAWVLLVVLAGYVFGNVPVVKANFELVVFGIVIVSTLPALIQYVRSRGRQE